MNNLKNEIDLTIKNLSKKVLLWVRVDDVGIYANNFELLCKMLVKHNIPVLFAVIPSLLDANTIKVLSSIKTGIISQHGYSHLNYNSSYQCELSDNRDLNILLKEIRNGKNYLKQTFGDRFYNILTPPFNKIDSRCANILKDEFACASIFGNSKTVFKKDFNPNVDIINWHINKFENENFILKQIQNALNNYTYIGICIHSEYLNKESLTILDDLFSWMTTKQNVSTDFKLFKELLLD